jgi:hypothetical protein
MGIIARRARAKCMQQTDDSALSTFCCFLYMYDKRKDDMVEE